MSQAGERLIKAAKEAAELRPLSADELNRYLHEALSAEFVPCVMVTGSGDTEMILRDCLMIWEQWDERTEIAKDESGNLVGVRLVGLSH